MFVCDGRWMHADRPAGTKGDGMDDQVKIVHHSRSPRHAPRDDKRQQSARAFHLALCQIILGVTAQSGIINVSDLGMLFEEFGNL